MFQKNGRFLFFIFSVWFLLVAISASVPAQVRVLPLGDGIVAGIGSPDGTGFRDDLFLTLQSIQPFDFVGTLNDGVSPDPDHEGHAGVTASQIAQDVTGYITTFWPHIVLIDLGTEDLLQNRNTSDVINQLSSIVDQIYAASPLTEIFLATLIPNQDATVNALVENLNAQIQNLCITKSALGIPVYCADVYQTFVANPSWATTYMTNDTYPNQIGYSLIANVFFNAISSSSGYLNVLNFEDHFDNRSALGPNWNAAPGFQINTTTGELENTSTIDTWDNQLAVVNSIFNPTSLSFRYSPNADLLGTAETGAAVWLDQASTTANGYLITINNSMVRLFQLTNGQVAGNLADVQIGIQQPSPGDLFYMTWDADDQGLHFRVFLNGAPLATLDYNGPAPDPNTTYYAGIMLKGNRQNNVDDVIISREVDLTPPAPVKDLTVWYTGHSTVGLQWTATGDDSLSGRAASYDLRYSMSPIDETNFAGATRVPMVITPADSGTLEKIVVAGLEPGQTYYFALKVKDDKENISTISNVVNVQTQDAAPFVDDFGRSDLGYQWKNLGGAALSNGTLLSTSTSSDWSSGAVLKLPANPFELGMKIAASTPGLQIGDVAIGIFADSLGKQGYLVRRDPVLHRFELYSVINGAPVEVLDSSTDNFPEVTPGDRLFVVPFQEGGQNRFGIFVNRSFYTLLTDANNIMNLQGTRYGGVRFKGNTSAAIEDFVVYTPVLIPSTLLLAGGDGQVDTVGHVLPLPLKVKALDANQQPVYFARVGFEITGGEAWILPPADVSGNVILEAEAGEIVAPFVAEAAADASGGQFVYAPQNSGEGGKAVYYFYVPTTADYYIWGRCIAPDGISDSFFLQVDQNPEIVWDVFGASTSSQWKWDKVKERLAGGGTQTYVVHLEAGLHRMVIRQREPGTKLDKLIITPHANYVPEGLGPEGLFSTDFAGIAAAYIRLGGAIGNVTVRAFLVDVPGQEVSFSLQAVSGPATRIVKISGDQQTGVAGQPLGQPFVVKVTDDFGNPISGYPVTFQVVAGNGHMVESQPVQTDASGLASSTLVLATNQPGNRVLAQAAGLQGSPVEFTATATAGIATTIEYVSGNNQNGQAGMPAPEPLVVRIVDGQGNPIQGYWVYFNVVSGDGSLSADSTQTDAQGKAAVTYTFGSSLGEHQIQAVAPGLTNSPILFTLKALSGPPAKMVKVSGDSAVGIILQPLAQPFVVQILDQFGNPVPSVGVLFTVVAGGGYLAGNGTQKTVQTDAQGKAQVTLVLGGTTGNYNNQVKAELAGIAGSPAYFVASALPPTATYLNYVSGNGQTGMVGKPLASPFVVKVTNVVGEPVKNHPVVFHVVSGNGRFQTNQDTVITTVTDSQGLASAVLICGTVAGKDVQVVKATSYVGDTPLIGSPVWFRASAKYPGAKIAIFRGNQQIGKIGTVLPLPLEVVVTDSQDQPVAGQPVEFHLISGEGKLDGSDTLVVKSTNVLGRASVTLTLGAPVGASTHVVRVSASDGFNPLQNSPLYFYASVTTTDAAILQKVSGDGQEGTVNQVLAQPVRVRVLDAHGNPVQGQDVQFRILKGGGQILGAQEDTLLTVPSDAQGYASVQWRLGTRAGTGNNRLEVRASNGVQELTNSPIVFVATAKPDLPDPDSSAVHVTTPVVANGQDQSQITVVLRDRFGNPVPGSWVEISATGQKNFITQPARPTDSTGTAIGYLASISPGTKTLTVLDKTHNIVLNSHPDVVFVADEARRIVLFAGNDQRRNVGTVLQNPLVVLVTDAFDNPVPNYPVNFVAKTPGGWIVEEQPVRTDSFGLAAVHYVLSETPGINSVEAHANLQGSPVIFIATGEENPPYQMRYVSGSNQTGTVGAVLPEPLVVEVLDQNGNPVKGVGVEFQFTLGTGSFVETMPVETDHRGYAVAHARLGGEVRAYVIQASVSGLLGSPVTFLADGRPDVPAQISVASGDGQKLHLESTSQPLTVLVSDRFGNPVPDAAVRFSIQSGDVSFETAPDVQTNSSGLASVVVRTATRSGIATVKATLADKPEEAVEFRLEILPGAPSQFVLVAGDGQTATVGHLLPVPLQGRVTDQYGNPVPGEQVTFIINSGDARFAGDSVLTTNDKGLVSCNLRLGEQPGTVEVIAVAQNVPGQVLFFRISAVVNRFPVLADIPDFRIAEMQPLDFVISADDPDQDSLYLTHGTLPPGASLVQQDRSHWKFSWTPNFEQAGSYSFWIQVWDGKGGTDRDTVNIVVENVNRPPVLTHFFPPADTTLITGQKLEFSVKAIDPDGDSIRYYWTLNGQNVSKTSRYEYTAPLNFTGSAQIVVFITDGTDTLKKSWIVTVKTNVELDYFLAEWDPEEMGVRLLWMVRSFRNTHGFTVVRAFSAEGPYKAISPKPIAIEKAGEFTFLDRHVQAGRQYYYKLIETSIDGQQTEFGPVAVKIQLPEELRLLQNYPNPFHLGSGYRTTRIRFELPQAAHIVLKIYNLLGQQVRTLLSSRMEPGFHQVKWDGKDASGKLVTSGVYYCVLKMADRRVVRRIVVIR